MLFWKRIHHRTGILPAIGAGIVVGMLFIAIFAPFVAPADPYAVHIVDKLKPPSWTHLLGTDEFGRDLWARVAMGSRVSLLAGFVVVAGAIVIGVPLGALAGYRGGWWDDTLMRVTDMFLSIPALILAMAINAALGSSLFNTVLALALVWWPWYARLVRGQFLALKEREYVEAAVAAGTGPMRLVRTHLLPNSLSPLIVQATLDFGSAILATTSLSFIGLGVQPPTPEWGSMVSEGRSYLLDSWWYATFPGLAIFLTVLAVNWLGDGLRDWWDVRTR